MKKKKRNIQPQQPNSDNIISPDYRALNKIIKSYMRNQNGLAAYPQYDGVEPAQKIVRFEDLRWMSKEVFIHRAFVNKRGDNLIQYAKPQRTKNDKGFIITLSDKDEKITDNDKKNIKYLTTFIMGMADPMYKDKLNLEIKTLSRFFKALVDETYTIDQLCVEIVRNKRNDVIAFNPVDGATIRRTTNFLRNDRDVKRIYDASLYAYNLSYYKDNIDFVQVMNEAVVAEFTQNDLYFSYMTPQLDSRYYGYGYSYFEQAVNIAIMLTYALEYNKGAFRFDKLPRGVLTVQGINDTIADKIQAYIHGVMTTPGGKWKVPILPTYNSGKDIQWINFNQNNKDMEFYKFLSFLTASYAAICDIDLAELGLKLEQSQSFIEHADMGDRIQFSQDAGLGAILNYVENVMNGFIHAITKNDRYSFRFVGYSIENEDKILEIQTKETGLFKSFNDIIIEADGKPQTLELVEGLNLYDIKGLNNQYIFQLIQGYIQNKQQEQQMAQQQQGQDINNDIDTDVLDSEGEGQELDENDIDIDALGNKDNEEEPLDLEKEADFESLTV